MRRIIPVGLALVGLGLALPAAATAGSPDTQSGFFAKKTRRARQTAPDPQFVPPAQPPMIEHIHTEGVPCAACEAAGPPTVVMTGACAACENGSTTLHTHPMAEGPGLASIGPAEAPGHAQLGGGMNAAPVFAEPTPIGVMQAGYRPQVQPPQGFQGGPVDVLALSEAREKEKRNAGPVAQTVGGMPGKPRSRPHILAHLFGFEGVFQMGRAREERRQSQHAAISYGPVNQAVTDLPASSVYGPSGH